MYLLKILQVALRTQFADKKEISSETCPEGAVQTADGKLAIARQREDLR